MTTVDLEDRPSPSPLELHSSLEENLQVGLPFAVVYLGIVTVCVAFISHVVVDAAESAVSTLGVCFIT
jgi:hypothetical protein